RETTQSRAGRRSQERLAPRAAPALDQCLAVSVVVVGELLAPSNPPVFANPDSAVDDVDVAVGAAGVVDEACDVAADAGVNHRPVGQLEAPDVSLADVPPLALQALLVRDLLPGVVDDAFVLGNGLGGIHAPPMDLRAPLHDHQSLRLPHVFFA